MLVDQAFVHTPTASLRLLVPSVVPGRQWTGRSLCLSLTRGRVQPRPPNLQRHSVVTTSGRDKGADDCDVLCGTLGPSITPFAASTLHCRT